MRNDNNSSPTVTNCTFFGNSATAGGGIADRQHSSSTVTNCILWADTGGEVYNQFSSSTAITYSNVQGSYPGTGNIDADPLFVDSEAGNLRLGPGSPCIDAANGLEAPMLDLDSNARHDDPDSPNTGIGPPWADMGAYEYQGSRTVDITTNQSTYYPGDSFLLELHTTNLGAPLEVARFVVLDVGNGQDYWYWPSWVQFPPDIDYEEATLPTGFYEVETILDFEWPADAGEGSGMRFWAALMSPDLAEIYAIDSCEFSFSEGEGPIGQPLQTH